MHQLFGTIRPLVHGGNTGSSTSRPDLNCCLRELTAHNQQIFPITVGKCRESCQQSALGHQPSTGKFEQQHPWKEDEQLPPLTSSTVVSSGGPTQFRPTPDASQICAPLARTVEVIFFRAQQASHNQKNKRSLLSVNPGEEEIRLNVERVGQVSIRTTSAPKLQQRGGKCP